jgi:hypothetical protein
MIWKRLAPPFVVAVILGVIGALAVWLQEPWMMPSLGSAIFVQILTPREPSARAWNTGLGQVAGIAGGFAGVYLAAATTTPTFMGDHKLVFARVLAVVIAVLVTAAVQLAIKATNPAGGATAMIVAMGLETANWSGAGRLVVGIALVTILGEAARHLILRKS